MDLGSSEQQLEEEENEVEWEVEAIDERPRRQEWSRTKGELVDSTKDVWEDCRHPSYLPGRPLSFLKAKKQEHRRWIGRREKGKRYPPMAAASRAGKGRDGFDRCCCCRRKEKATDGEELYSEKKGRREEEEKTEGKKRLRERRRREGIDTGRRLP
jgi:hypothetical protein